MLRRMSSLDEYAALVHKVDTFARAVGATRAADLACREGCDACCHVHLSVSEVEAATIRRYLDSLDEEARAAIAERARANTEMPESEAPRCAFLDGEGACSIYSARPLVCRTQGLALRYSNGLIPAEAIMARAPGGELTWCPLNFTHHPPDSASVLDAERLDELLALVNRRYCESIGADPVGRVALAEIAAPA